MAKSFWVDSFGVRFRVESNDEDLLELVWQKIKVADWERRTDPVDRLELCVTVLREDGQRPQEITVTIAPDLHRTFTHEEGAAELCRTELHLRLAQSARDFLFIHAGVVRYKNQALLFPGYSGAGKSSLVQALVEQGCQYFSDEYAVLNRQGLVCAFPRPLRMRQPLWEVIPAEQLGWTSTVEPLKVGAIFTLVFKPSADWNVEPLSPGLTALELFSNTVDAQARGGDALTWLRRPCADCIYSVKGYRGDSGSATRHIMAAL